MTVGDFYFKLQGGTCNIFPYILSPELLLCVIRRNRRHYSKNIQSKYSSYEQNSRRTYYKLRSKAYKRPTTIVVRPFFFQGNLVVTFTFGSKISNYRNYAPFYELVMDCYHALPLVWRFGTMLPTQRLWFGLFLSTLKDRRLSLFIGHAVFGQQTILVCLFIQFGCLRIGRFIDPILFRRQIMNGALPLPPSIVYT